MHASMRGHISLIYTVLIYGHESEANVPRRADTTTFNAVAAQKLLSE